jgi:hypothetical protein
MLAQQQLSSGRSFLRLLSVRQQARRVTARAVAPPRMAQPVGDASTRTPDLPDAICVHCGQRFNSAHLSYGIDAKLLSPEARGFGALRTPLWRV